MVCKTLTSHDSLLPTPSRHRHDPRLEKSGLFNNLTGKKTQLTTHNSPFMVRPAILIPVLQLTNRNSQWTSVN